MKVIIVGLPLFANKLAEELKTFDSDNQYVALNTYYSFIDKIKFIYHIFSSDIVYSLNGTISYSKVFNLSLFLNKKVMMQWMGTDVLVALEAYKKSDINRKFIERTSHFAETPWLIKELGQIGLNAKKLYLTTVKENNDSLELPDRFSAICYIGKHREKFYGIDILIRIAKILPDIEFKVFGIDRYVEKLPSNIILSGWIKDVNKLLVQSVLFLRLAEHDGLAKTVVEALNLGLYVIWKYDLPNTDKFLEESDIVEKIKKYKSDFDSGILQRNIKGTEFVQQEFNKKKVLRNLVKTFQQSISN